MANQFTTRKLISSNLGMLRVLQSGNFSVKDDGLKGIVNKVNSSWPTLKKVKMDMIEAKIISEDFKINSSFAFFVGISIYQNTIEISVVGLDGKPLSWDFLSSHINNCPKNFDGKLSFDYSMSSLIDASNSLKQLICDLECCFPIKAICFSFDDINLKNKTFSFSNYFTGYTTSMYSFNDFCDLCLKDISDNIELYLDCNSVCQIISEEFPCCKKDNDSVYINISQTGCYATTIIHNKIRNLKSFEISNLITESEKHLLLENTVSSSEFFSICKKLIYPFSFSLLPEYFSIGHYSLKKNSDIFTNFILQKFDVFKEFGFTENNIPDFKFDTISSLSKGAALSAMYQYYGWDYTCI
ncbi:MAG: hypothetical protein IJB90_03605 [Clostridia bacterium]|nr:hypothetical protein [Clostridia bacterium]